MESAETLPRMARQTARSDLGRMAGMAGRANEHIFVGSLRAAMAYYMVQYICIALLDRGFVVVVPETDQLCRLLDIFLDVYM